MGSVVISLAIFRVNVDLDGFGATFRSSVRPAVAGTSIKLVDLVWVPPAIRVQEKFPPSTYTFPLSNFCNAVFAVVGAQLLENQTPPAFLYRVMAICWSSHFWNATIWKVAPPS